MHKNKVVVENVEGNFILTEEPEQRVNSVISELLTEISLKPIQYDMHSRGIPADVIVKIEHNNLNSQVAILGQYQLYSSSIESAYDNIDKTIVNGKANVLLMLKDYYFKALYDFGLNPYLGNMDIEEIRKNSDSILIKIINNLKDFCYKSANVPSHKESVEIGVNVIVAHAFVECLILENPNAPH